MKHKLHNQCHTHTIIQICKRRVKAQFGKVLNISYRHKNNIVTNVETAETLSILGHKHALFQK